MNLKNYLWHNNFFITLLSKYCSYRTFNFYKKVQKQLFADQFYSFDLKYIDYIVNYSFIGDRNAAYDQFLEELQKAGTGECRYGLFDFEYTHQCQGTSEVSYRTFH